MLIALFLHSSPRMYAVGRCSNGVMTSYRAERSLREKNRIIFSTWHKLGTSKLMMWAETRQSLMHRWWQWLCKTLIRKVAKDFKGNPRMFEPSFLINSLILRIQTQFYRSLYWGLLIEGLLTGLWLYVVPFKKKSDEHSMKGATELCKYL